MGQLCADRAAFAQFRLVTGADNARIAATLRFLPADHVLRPVPDVYVYYLEQRVATLESLLEEHRIHFPPADDVTLQGHGKRGSNARAGQDDAAVQKKTPSENDDANDQTSEEDDTEKWVDKVGMVPTQGTSDPRYLGSAAGLSFARVVFAAIRSSVWGPSGSSHHPKAASGPTKASMRDSFFGLHSKSTIDKAPFPEKGVAMRLVDLYFNYANAQLPILHRGEFLSRMEEVYNEEEGMRGARDLFMLNIVFAIGAGVVLGDAGSYGAMSPEFPDSSSETGSPPLSKKRKLPGQQARPEEYHASAVFHLESFLGSKAANDSRDGFDSGLEELQAVLLVASFALLRPVAPGLWYIVGTAVRLAIDLGLHHEEGIGIDESSAADHPAETLKTTDARAVLDQHGDTHSISSHNPSHKPDAKELGRRPFGISDQVITTEFCSELDDSYITPSGILPFQSIRPSYKLVAYHYFRLRLLQSEILGVLQYRQARQARLHGLASTNTFMVDVPSPYLQGFHSFKEWRENVDYRLLKWEQSAPQKEDTGVQFTSLFLELNYWQAIILLYRQSFSGPSASVGGMTPADDVAHTPVDVIHDDDEDPDLVYMKIAEAGRRVVKIYRQLHRQRLVNYTYLATHHLFMAGISFLFAIWHSQVVRNGLTLEEIDSTVLAAKSVLEDLTEHCPPAQACREAFDRMSKATIRLCLSTKDTGFVGQPELSPIDMHPVELNRKASYPMSAGSQSASMASVRSDSWTGEEQSSKMPMPQFDMNLQNLLSGGRVSGSRPSRIQPINRSSTMDLDQRSSQFAAPRHPVEIKKDLDELSPTQFPPPSYQPPSEAPAPPEAPPPTQFPSLAAPESGQLDFLNSFNMENADEWDLSAPENLDLGFGMQLNMWEGGHDWSEAVSSDLLNGFFFGGSGGGNAGGS
ncbi:MAG: hypothetical protein Q9157_005887 [Trypethelium eluteriae]